MQSPLPTKHHRRSTKVQLFRRLLMLTIGAIIFALGLKGFLVPNNIIDGGIVGISIIGSKVTDTTLALWLFFLNIPFIFFGYKQIGKTFALSTLYAIFVMAIATKLFEHIGPLTSVDLLATVFGGLILGIGVGIVIRSSGSLDGTEILAVSFSRSTPFSVGEIVMFFNVFILGAAGFVFGWDRAMYSLITYFVAFKTIDVVIDGLDQSKSVWIISENYEEIGLAIMDRLGRSMTYLNGEGAFTGDGKKVIFCVISRLEESKLKDIVRDFDEQAFIAIGNIHDVHGGRFKKKDIH
ncbi:YitT family protein [Exiguobacterium sp.]|uniref:YitT family protein n=3 Tax=Exiguobacterium sp. TaxID=44751 RepID=UPI000EC48326|nr:YitT family protein [Exiguobacterium sp.]HAL01480.1 hypothetical protein [Exiguobacterium sp.]